VVGLHRGEARQSGEVEERIGGGLHGISGSRFKARARLPRSARSSRTAPRARP
jgi:hypothetical protein